MWVIHWDQYTVWDITLDNVVSMSVALQHKTVDTKRYTIDRPITEFTASMYINSIRQFLKYLHMLWHNVPYNIPSPNFSNSTKKHVKNVENWKAQELIKACEVIQKNKEASIRDKLLFMLWLYCGIRIQEVLNLCFCDVQDKIVTFIQKWWRERTVVFNDDIMKQIEILRNFRKEKTKVMKYDISENNKNYTIIKKIYTDWYNIKDYIFISYGGTSYWQQLTQWWVRKNIELYRKHIWLDFTYHQLRHTFGTAVYEATGDLLATQQMMGHKSLQSTSVYAKMSTDQMTKIQEKITAKL